MTSSLAHLAVVSLLWGAAMGLAQSAPSKPGLKTMTPMGCFSSSESLEDQGPWTYQTRGYCQPICVGLNKPVMGLTGGSNCWCGDLLPAAENKVDESECNFPCDGFDKEMCGGDGRWTVYLTGLKPSVRNAEPSSSPKETGLSSSPTDHAPASTRTAPPQVVTVGGQTQTVTAGDPGPTSTSPSASKSSGSGSKAGIAAGVVVGVLVLCALAGGIFLYVRMRRRKAVEDEYRRNAEINRFVAGGKEGSMMSDSRLEPSVMANRRMSDGSIADNQDYSRRILKVTNPDGT